MLMGRKERGGQQWGGGNSAMGAIVGGGGVFSTSKNRPSHHKYKSPKPFELKQLRGSYAVFEDEKSKPSDKKSVKRKIA